MHWTSTGFAQDQHWVRTGSATDQHWINTRAALGFPLATEALRIEALDRIQAEAK